MYVTLPENKTNVGYTITYKGCLITMAKMIYFEVRHSHDIAFNIYIIIYVFRKRKEQIELQNIEKFLQSSEGKLHMYWWQFCTK
jgi:hypothetical protein